MPENITIPTEYYLTLQRESVALNLLVSLGRLSLEDLEWLESETGHSVFESEGEDADTQY